MWHTSRRAVCDFIEACLPAAQYAAQAGLKLDVDVPLSFRGQLGRLLDMLCTQYDWHLDQDNLTLLNRDDQLTEAINTTRARAPGESGQFRILGVQTRRQSGSFTK